jgi:Adenosine deaminase
MNNKDIKSKIVGIFDKSTPKILEPYHLQRTGRRWPVTRLAAVLLLAVLVFAWLWHSSMRQLVGNETTRKYHLPTCVFLPKTKTYFKTAKEAAERGYTPCAKCIIN